MSHYKSNVRDIEFNLFEVLGREEILGVAPYADLMRRLCWRSSPKLIIATTRLAELLLTGMGLYRFSILRPI